MHLLTLEACSDGSSLTLLVLTGASTMASWLRVEATTRSSCAARSAGTAGARLCPESSSCRMRTPGTSTASGEQLIRYCTMCHDDTIWHGLPAVRCTIAFDERLALATLSSCQLYTPKCLTQHEPVRVVRALCTQLAE